MEERLKELKPEGKEYTYQFCILCDKPEDGTELMREFGICRDCCQRLLDSVPADLYAQIGRLYIYASKKQLFLGDSPKQKNLEGRKNDRSIFRHSRSNRN
jgi:hypothetical protein